MKRHRAQARLPSRVHNRQVQIRFSHHRLQQDHGLPGKSFIRQVQVRV